MFEELVKKGYKPYIERHWMSTNKAGVVITFHGKYEGLEFRCSYKVAEEVLAAQQTEQGGESDDKQVLQV